jgi:RP/EB family microtubule-associated protein
MVVGESRSQLLEWLNATLELNYTKVEECGTGAAFCQLMDCTVGGVAMNKVKFDSNYDYDNRQNWKLLQASFTKNNITKVIDVERLIKCRLQDNLELLQWFKRFWMENKGFNDDYDVIGRRKGQGYISGSGTGNSTPRNVSTGTRVSSGGASFHGTPTGGSGGTITPGSTRSLSGTTKTSSRTSSRTSSNTLPGSANPTTSPFTSSRRSIISPNNSQPSSRRVSSYGRAPQGTTAPTPTSQPLGTPKAAQLSKELSSALSDVSHLREEVKEYKLSAETLETERNFYFNKLREIEILIQNIDDLIDTNNFSELKDLTVVDLTKKIQTILYSTEEGFQTTHDFDEISNVNVVGEVNGEEVKGEEVNGEKVNGGEMNGDEMNGEVNISMTEGDGYYSDGGESF